MLFTSNASGGGTCSGDFGGPIFVEGTNVIAAVTSYGLNARCAGTGGGYRVDTADDLTWLASFGLEPGTGSAHLAVVERARIGAGTLPAHSPDPGPPGGPP